MIKHLIYFVISIFILSPSVVKASIICPPDINLFCDADIHNTNVTGMPTVFGHPWALVTYEDQSFLNGCNTGYVLRKWYVDEDQNNTWSAGEPQCVQTITLAYIVAQTEVFFPPDRTFDCLEEVTNDRPDWYSGQCDMIGVNVKEDTFLVAPDACYKIMRHFRVINWCTYQPENPMWNGEGLWVHTQVIKVIDDRKPIMASCEKILIPTNKECAARVTLTNSAIDNAACALYLLSWKAEVDLWQDGTLDYVFSFTETGDFYLAPVNNGDEVSITLPKDVPQGIHSVKWAVRDQCGNFTSCT